MTGKNPSRASGYPSAKNGHRNANDSHLRVKNERTKSELSRGGVLEAIDLMSTSIFV
jgi:hypothetical protein